MVSAACVRYWNIRNMHTMIPSPLQQVFLSFSSPFSRKVQHRLWHIDRTLSRSASGFNTATSQHVNSSTGYTSYLLCPKVTTISPLWTTQITWQPHWCEHQHLCALTSSEDRLSVERLILRLHRPHCLLSMHKAKLHLCVCVCVIKALWSGVIGTNQSNGCVQQTMGFSSHRCPVLYLS